MPLHRPEHGAAPHPPGHRDHGIGRGVVPLEMGKQRRAVDGQDRVAGADGRHPQRQLRPEQGGGEIVGADLLPPLVEVFARLLEDDAPFHFQIRKLRPQQHRGEDRQTALQLVGVNPGVVAGGLGVGGGVDRSADRLEGPLQFQAVGELGGAAKHHVFEEVGDAGALGRLVAAADADVADHLGAVQVGHLHGHDAQAVGQGIEKVFVHQQGFASQQG